MTHTNQRPVNSVPRDRDSCTLNQLADVAVGLSWLAKQLSSPHRATAYRLKAAAVSALILAGAARVNGKREKNTFGLDILTDRRTQLHIVLGDLSPQAQSEVLRQAKAAPAVAPFWERLDADQVRSIKAHVCPKANCAA